MRVSKNSVRRVFIRTNCFRPSGLSDRQSRQQRRQTRLLERSAPFPAGDPWRETPCSPTSNASSREEFQHSAFDSSLGNRTCRLYLTNITQLFGEKNVDLNGESTVYLFADKAIGKTITLGEVVHFSDCISPIDETP